MFAELFDRFESEVWVTTPAVFVIDGIAPRGGLTTIVTVAVAPEANVPRSALTIPLATVGWGVPGAVLAEMKITFDGSTSLKVTPTASLGPLLVTVAV